MRSRKNFGLFKIKQSADKAERRPQPFQGDPSPPGSDRRPSDVPQQSPTEAHPDVHVLSCLRHQGGPASTGPSSIQLARPRDDQGVPSHHQEQ